jgi:hypothetical protein
MYKLIAAVLILAALVTGAHAEVPLLDRFEQAARKALSPANPYHLKSWQREGYRAGLKGIIIQRRAFVTTYYPSEGKQGKETASGVPPSLRTAAANLIGMGSFVWIPDPAHLRKIEDTGAHWNDTVAKAPIGIPVYIHYRGRDFTCYGKGADLWMDLWLPVAGYRGISSDTKDVIVIPR